MTAPPVSLWQRQVQPRWRLLRRHNAQRGPFDCNLCGWQGGYLAKAPDARERHCPRCKGANRHRLIAWYLRHAGIPAPEEAVLHVAPEPALGAIVAGMAGRGYVTCDLVRRDVDHRLDLQHDILGDSRFDLILVNHVLEHVPDDRAVLRNLHRMLKPGGTCLITVPMRDDGGLTDEDASVNDPQQRQERFGQRDHLRLYGRDLADRLSECGYAASSFVSAAADAAAVARYSMQGETIFLGCRGR